MIVFVLIINKVCLEGFDDGEKVLDLDENTNQMFHEEIDSSTLPRSINIQNSVPAPAGTVVDLSTYQVRCSQSICIRQD